MVLLADLLLFFISFFPSVREFGCHWYLMSNMKMLPSSLGNMLVFHRIFFLHSYFSQTWWSGSALINLLSSIHVLGILALVNTCSIKDKNPPWLTHWPEAKIAGKESFGLVTYLQTHTQNNNKTTKISFTHSFITPISPWVHTENKFLDAFGL